MSIESICVCAYCLATFYNYLLISERKVQPNEYPHSLYIANYSTAAATCLVIKRWLFDLETEESIYRDPVALDFIFQEVFTVGRLI